jgi:hypothetical protein
MTSGTGTVAVTFSQAGDNNYNAATLVEEEVAAQKANQTITVTQAAPTSAVYGTSFGVAATASSGLAVSIASSGVGWGSGSGSASITMTSGTGTAAVTFSQAGDKNYNAATVVEEDVTAQKADQTITVTQMAPGSAVYGTSFTVAATTSSGLAVSIAASGAGSGGGNGSASITMTSGTGTAAVTFTQAGDSNYNAATVEEDVIAQKASQTITVTPTPPANAVTGASFSVAATASSGLAVSIAASGAAGGNGTSTATVTIIGGSGTGTITFTQAGDANYASATVQDTVNVVGTGTFVVGTELWYVGTNTSGSKADNWVRITPAGTSRTGSTGVVVNGTTYSQSFTAIRIFGYNGDDDIRINSGLTISTFITEGNGNNVIQAGNNNNSITLGNGNNLVWLGNGNNVIIVGDGNNYVRVGDGNNVVVVGNGNDIVRAGNGDNLIEAGTGAHNIRVGNGNNIIIDGSVSLTQSSDSLSQVLGDWIAHSATASNVASIRARFKVTYNTSHANILKASTGLDWFWDTYVRDKTNRKLTDLLN